MLLADFIDTSYALWVEERQRIQPLADFEALAQEILPRDARVERIPDRREVKDQNTQAMDALKGMLANVQNAPKGAK